MELSDDEWMNIIIFLPINNFLKIMLCKSTFNHLIQSRWNQVLNTVFGVSSRHDAKQLIIQLLNLSFDTEDCVTKYLEFRENDTLVSCSALGDFPVRFNYPILKEDVVFCMEYLPTQKASIEIGFGIASKPCLDRFGSLNNMIFCFTRGTETPVDNVSLDDCYLGYYYLPINVVDYGVHQETGEYFFNPESDFPIQLLNAGFFTNGFM
jgi:hypothetical protein